MKNYLEVTRKILDNGVLKKTRTGISAISIPGGAQLQHDLDNGFPLLTTCKKPFKVVAVELEGFLKGITDKSWYRERNCHIWDEWCNPRKVSYGTDEKTKKKMINEQDLGPIYGYQWRRFNMAYQEYLNNPGMDPDKKSPTDQLNYIVEILKSDPSSRRMICSAWNPQQLNQMALPPCHMFWGVQFTGERLHLHWTQRSADWALGVPFNIASYSLLLHLLCKTTGMKPGIVTGTFWDAHIYENHVDGMQEQIKREPKEFPALIFKKNDISVFNWSADDVAITGYDPHPKISFEIAV